MYGQNFNQYQNYVPQFQQYQVRGLSGRLVDDFNTITANEIPMDGNVAVFIKRDLSEIQVRSWMPDGTIKSYNYGQKSILIPQTKILPTEEKQLKIDEEQSVWERNVESKLNRIEELLTVKTSPKAKKVETDE